MSDARHANLTQHLQAIRRHADYAALDPRPHDAHWRAACLTWLADIQQELGAAAEIISEFSTEDRARREGALAP